MEPPPASRRIILRRHIHELPKAGTRMILRTLLAAALLVTAAAHADFDRTLSVSAQPDLYVSTGSGRVHIFPGSDSQIHVKAHVHAGWNAGGDIEDRIRQINANPPIRQSGNEVHLGETNDNRLYNNITIDYEIAAPRAVALNLHTGSGDIAVDNLGRFLKADTGSGSNPRQRQSPAPPSSTPAPADIELQQASPRRNQSLHRLRLHPHQRHLRPPHRPHRLRWH